VKAWQCLCQCWLGS